MIISFLAIFLGVVLATWIMPKQYEAHMKILVRQERADPVVSPESNSQLSIRSGVSEEDLNSEVELLKSRDLLEKVVVLCSLHTRKGDSLLEKLLSNGEAKGEEPDMRIPRAVRTLEKELEVEPLRKTRMIEVRYRSSSPQLAAKVLETLSNLYMIKHLAVHRPAGALDFFAQQTEQYRKGLTDADSKLEVFGRQQGVVAANLEKTIIVQKLNEFEASLQQTGAGIAETRHRIEDLEKQLAAIPSRKTTQVKMTDNAYLLQNVKATLLSLELKRMELLTKFDPSYRSVQEVEAEIARTREALESAEKAPLREEVTDRDPTHDMLLGDLARARAELTALEARQSAITQTVVTYREMARRLNQKEIIQGDLQREAKTAEENYLLYVRKQEEARISDALDQKRIVNVAIAEAATVPALPSRPRWGLNLLLGFLLAGMTSLGLAFTADYVDPTFRTPEEVESYLDLQVLASLPKN
jgi:uncharacterized protein involved in exopolysaccharide biosynthesis